MPQPADPTAAPTEQPRSPAIPSQTKLMHQYRVASPMEITAAPARDVFTLDSARHGATGDVHVFTIGTGGHVWDIYPDPTSPTGYGKVDTGLRGTIAANTFPGGLMLWAATGRKLTYKILRDTWSEATTPPTPVDLNQWIARIVLNPNDSMAQYPGMALLAYLNGDDTTDPLIYTHFHNPSIGGWSTFAPQFTAVPPKQMRPRAAAFYLRQGATDLAPDIVVGSPTAQPAQYYNIGHGTRGTLGDTRGLASLDNVTNLNTFDNLFGVQGGGGWGGNLLRLLKSNQVWQAH